MSYASCGADSGDILIGNDVALDLELRDPVTDDLVIDAQVLVTARLVTVLDDGTRQQGATVPGVTWPQVLVYDAADGQYHGAIQSEAEWVAGGDYDVTFVSSTPGGADSELVIASRARRRYV